LILYEINELINLSTETFKSRKVNFVVANDSAPPNGLRYLRVGGRGFALGAEKTRSQKNA
jgi:hypothetical protein